MKYVHILATASIMLTSFTAYSAPFGERTNCRYEKTGEQNIYSGFAFCDAKVSQYEYVGISQYVPVSLTPKTTIFGAAYTSLGYTYLSCDANVPFSHREDVTKEVCDYKPQANFIVRAIYDGTAYEAGLQVVKQGRDYDGHIIKHEFTVNGVNYGSSVTGISVSTPTQFNVIYKVTDNDGYTNTQSKTIIVSPNNDTCLDGVVSC